ncbi:MAG: HAD family phosphatase [Gaiella sp.]|nr:HAD family phosphatase [Gaiella sp.]
MPASEPIEAVVFDMDGVLVDTEHLWDEVREALTREWGGRYTPEAQEAMMGMSSLEWSRYLHEVVGLREPPETINAEVVRRMLARYDADLPVVPGAVEAVRRLGSAGFRLAVASSSNRELIDGVLRRLRLSRLFDVTVSSEEVARGKPSPDVYLETARRLGVPPRRCAAIEDSASGIRAAHAAGMRVLAYPNRHYPPAGDVLALADVVLESLGALGSASLRTASPAA